MIQRYSPVLGCFSYNHSRPSFVHTGRFAKATRSHIITPSQCPVSTAFLGLFPLCLPVKTYMAAESRFRHCYRPPNGQTPHAAAPKLSVFISLCCCFINKTGLSHERRVWPFTTILSKVVVVVCLDTSPKIRIARAATVTKWLVLHTRVL